jgi:NDP-sugar pyrophosphorylase family protein
MPVAGEPIVRRIIRWLHDHKVDDVVMNLHHLPATLTAVVGDGSDLGVRLRYSWEAPDVLGSAGGPRRALSTLGTERFLIINGDTLTDIDPSSVAAAHETTHALVTLAVVPNRHFERYGGVFVDDEGSVTGFSRRGAEARDTWHFVGVQAVEASVFADLPAGVPLNTIGGIYDELIRAKPGSVRAYRCEGGFWDVGTGEDYLQTSLEFSHGSVSSGRHAVIDPTAHVERSVLWDDVQVAAGAQITDCILADGVRVPAGAVYRRTILLQRGDDLLVTPIEG